MRWRLYVARTKADFGAVSDSGAIRSRKVRGLNGESRRSPRFVSNPLILLARGKMFRPGMKQDGEIRANNPIGPCFRLAGNMGARRRQPVGADTLGPFEGPMAKGFRAAMRFFCGVRAANALIKARGRTLGAGRLDPKLFRPPRKPEPLA
jgi:hypothetical protein